MRKSGWVVFVLVLSLLTAVAKTGNDKKPIVKKGLTTPAIEVYYFHFTRRCATCQAVESETKKAIMSLYARELKAGKLFFRSVNMDEHQAKAFIEKCDVEGQSLLVIKGKKRFDLTNDAFMYAKTNPGRLKQTLKATIDSLLK